MLKRTTSVLICIATLTLGSYVYAQEASATFVLRSGERVNGQLIDLGGSGFTLRVNGRDRNIGAGDVASVEFVSGGALQGEWINKLNAGQPIIVLRNGQIIEGRLFDVSGAGSAKLTIDTNSGQRELNVGEVAQIYYVAPAGAAAPSAVATSGASGTALERGAISVPANQVCTPTGIRVRSGERIGFRTTGQIQLSGDPNDRAGAAGAMSQRKAGGSPLPNDFAGALVARIDNGGYFAIGDSSAVTMPAAGFLFLCINDDAVQDNSGNFSVVMSRGR